MKLNLFVFKNAILGASGNPIFDDHGVEQFVEGMRRKVLTSKPEDVVMFENTTLYKVGEYDDESLKFSNCEPILLLDFNKVLEERKLKYEIMKKVLEAREKKDGDKNGKSKA